MFVVVTASRTKTSNLFCKCLSSSVVTRSSMTTSNAQNINTMLRRKVTTTKLLSNRNKTIIRNEHNCSSKTKLFSPPLLRRRQQIRRCHHHVAQPAYHQQGPIIVGKQQRRGNKNIMEISKFTTMIFGRQGVKRFTTTTTTNNSSNSTSSSSSSSWLNKNKNTMLLGSLSIVMGTSIYYYLHYLFGGYEGIQRSVSFYTVAIPKYIEYRYHMIMESEEKVWDDLHTKTSRVALSKMLQLQGFYIKSGQMCAANIGNAFPPIWQDTMSILQDQVPHKPYEIIKQIVQDEYKCPIEEIFDTFEEIPIGAASIGQVHKATLKKDNKYVSSNNRNRNVVVKVMYPEAEEYFRGDVRTIKLFAQLAQPVHVPALNEIEKQFLTEFDYVKEANQLDLVRYNLLEKTKTKTKAASSSSKQYNFNDKCIIPKPYLELCTKRVLVMEELNGNKLVDVLKQDLINNAQRSGKSVQEFLDEQKQREEQRDKEQHSSEGLQGPTSNQYDTYIKLLNTKRIIQNFSYALYNYTIGFVAGNNKKEYIKKSTLPLNHAKLINDLIYIHGHEVLVDGCFNGDPHPGNILLVDVDTGKPKLGLIDYGQVPKLAKDKRLLFCKLIIALADDNRDEIISLMKDAGYKSKFMDKDIIYKYAKVGYDEDNYELTGGKHIQLFMEDIQSIDPIETLPKEFLMVSRCSIMLRGLAHALHQSRSVAKIWKPIAIDVLKQEGLL